MSCDPLDQVCTLPDGHVGPCRPADTDRISDLERQLAEAQAQMGAMREALVRLRQGEGISERGRLDVEGEAFLDAALAPETGKELLARLEKAETDLARLGATTLHEVLEPDRVKTRNRALGDAIKQLEKGKAVAMTAQEAATLEWAIVQIWQLAESTSPDVAE